MLIDTGYKFNQVVVCNRTAGNFSTILVTGYKHRNLKNMTSETITELFGTNFFNAKHSVNNEGGYVNIYFPDKKVALLMAVNEPKDYKVLASGLFLDLRIYSINPYKTQYSKSTRFYPVNPFFAGSDRAMVTMLIYKALGGVDIIKPVKDMEKEIHRGMMFESPGTIQKCKSWAPFVYDEHVGRLLGFKDDKFGLPCLSIASPNKQTICDIVDKYSAFVTRFTEKAVQTKLRRIVKTIRDAGVAYETIPGFDTRWKNKFSSSVNGMYEEVNKKIDKIFFDLNVSDLFELAKARGVLDIPNSGS